MENSSAFLYVAIVIALVSWVAWLSSRQEHKRLQLEARRMQAQIFELQSENARLLKQLAEKPVKKAPKKKPKQKPSDKVATPEPPRPVEPAHNPVEAANSQPVIITRTGNARGRAIDTWQGERAWTKPEISKVLDLYSQGKTVHQMAISLNLDAKDIVHAIGRAAFSCEGDLEDRTVAINDGLPWTTVQRNRVGALIRSGRSIKAIADEYGRTQIAIVWQAIENGFTRS
jgi:hypothetical protein